MSTSLTCDEESRRSNAERYAAHRMTTDEVEAFEDHFVTCPECQAEVRFASAVLSGLPHDAVPTRATAPTRRIWAWVGGGLLLAASLATLTLIRLEPPRELVALGAVREPPVYLGVAVRGADSPQDSLMESAMRSYANRRYAAAVTDLRAVLAGGQDSVAAQFFLATSLLLDNHPREAVDEYARVLARGDTPYRAEASYYRAKALLRVGRASDARASLAHLAPDDGAVYEMGRALADSVARLR